MNEFAAKIGINPTVLGRAFRAVVGVGLATYFNHARLRRAKRLLRGTGEPVHVIARTCGFGTRITLFRMFKRATGMGPDAYRARAKRRKM